ncbi:MAG: imidazole glycerol phosphate synthase subunit HisH [Acidobacteriota bacterium]
MVNSIAILDFGVGNLKSIENMLRKAGVSGVSIARSPDGVAAAAKLILPGVGHFDNGMKKLRDSGLCDILNEKVLGEKVPVLGICLGAQMLTNGSEEGVETGLGWIKARCERFDIDKMQEPLSIPHMGWADVTSKKKSPLTSDLPDEPRFYFTHSYHVVCEDPADVLLSADYGVEFTAAIARGNIFGTQFHPEKSHKFGMKILANFAAL